MSVDYGEIICKAVDEIVSTKLQGLQYDITKLCTIIDDEYSHQGKYVVSDGTARYEAFTNDTKLKKGNQVLVSIPNGDYNLTKTIKGRVAATDTTPFNYTSPLDTMITITNNILGIAKNNEGLLANGNTLLSGPLYSITNAGDLIGYSRLGISANFRSWLNGLDVAAGSYGIKVLIYQETGNSVYELTFSSADMIGNPYQFEDYFYQEKVFDISQIEKIARIDVYFYQDSNFVDGNGNRIPHTSTFGDAEIDNANNLFVDGVKIFLGYDISEFSGETLRLYSPDKTSYRYSDEVLEKNIYLRWIHKIDEKTYEVLNSSNFDDNKYEIRWFKYSPGIEDIDPYAGKNWQKLDNFNKFQCAFLPEVKKQNEQIKVVGLIKGEVNKGGVVSANPYFSNILTFENEELVPDQATLEASTALSIYCEDNSEGNYFIYNQNGKINNEGSGRGRVRKLKAMFKGAEITEDIGTINYIKWYFPKNERTMLITTQEMWSANGGEYDQNKHISYRGVDYIEVTRDNPPVANLYQEYAIANQWARQMGNNTVICRISINGIEYEALEELRFGKAGTNGTNVSFLIEFGDNNNALPVGENSSVNVYARLYGNGDETVNGIPEGAKINWDWYSKSTNDYITISANADYCTLSTSQTTMPIDNYYILRATYNYNGTDLEAYLPIAMKDAAKCSFIEGAREVIYNHQGVPYYYDGAYVAYGLDEEKLSSEWNISYLAQGAASPVLGDCPMGGKALKANSIYVPEDNQGVCVYCDCWSQPVLIMQSRYDFAMLNDWDGNFQISEKDGTILSTMLSAGRKNKNNTYSGVLIGDIKAGTGNKEASIQTGVYGINEGVVSYALKEDGTAIFGASGKGQIVINGKEGTIKSADESMRLDLDDGRLTIKDENKNEVVSLSAGKKENEPYLEIKGNDNGTYRPLIHIDDSKYYLQSINYKDVKDGGFMGTQFDLGTGTLKLSGGANSGTISLTPNNQKYLFEVKDELDTPLIQMGAENYYLQSAGYNGIFQSTATINGKDCKLYTNKNRKFQNGTNEIDKVGTTVAVDPERRVYIQDENMNWSEIIFEETTFKADESENNKEPAKRVENAEQRKEAFLAGLFAISTTGTPAGLKIDLKKGTIDGYNLYLRGVGKHGSIIIDSTNETTPFSIGENFNVAWDGTLTCNKINSLNDDGRNNMAISVNNNFYVSKSGGAGGSSASFGYGGFGGIGCSGALNVSGITTFSNTVECKTGLVVSGGSLSLDPGNLFVKGSFFLKGGEYTGKTITSSNGTVYTALGHE